MGTSTVNISGVVYDGALATPGSVQFNVGASNPTPPPLKVATIITSATTPIVYPAGTIGAFINTNLSAGSVTVGGQPIAPIGTNYISLVAGGGTLTVVTTGITGTVEVMFV